METLQEEARTEVAVLVRRGGEESGDDSGDENGREERGCGGEERVVCGVGRARL